MVKVAGIAAKIAHRASAIGHDEARRFGIAARIYDIGMLALPGPVRERRTEIAPARCRAASRRRTSNVRVKCLRRRRPGSSSSPRSSRASITNASTAAVIPTASKSTTISIYAQLVLVAETFNDAVTTGPPGSSRTTPLSEVQALAYIDRQSGTTFDPEVVEGLRLMVESPIGDPLLPAKV